MESRLIGVGLMLRNVNKINPDSGPKDPVGGSHSISVMFATVYIFEGPLKIKKQSWLMNKPSYSATKQISELSWDILRIGRSFFCCKLSKC